MGPIQSYINLSLAPSCHCLLSPILQLWRDLAAARCSSLATDSDSSTFAVGSQLYWEQLKQAGGLAMAPLEQH